MRLLFLFTTIIISLASSNVFAKNFYVLIGLLRDNHMKALCP